MSMKIQKNYYYPRNTKIESMINEIYICLLQ